MLTGVLHSRAPVHQNSSRDRERAEESKANSPRRSVRADWKGEVLVAVEDVRGLWRDADGEKLGG